MSTDIENLIVSSLRARAGDEIDAGALTVRAVARWRSRLLRRRVEVACVALLTVGAAVAVSSLVDRPTAGVEFAKPPSFSVPPLPFDVDAPPLTQRPELVGTDPGLVHFTADALTGSGLTTLWFSGDGIERLYVTTADNAGVWINLGRDRAALDGVPFRAGDLRFDATSSVLVGDRPGVLERAPAPESYASQAPMWVLTWQPVDGVWARAEVQAANDEAIRVAASRCGSTRCAAARCRSSSPPYRPARTWSRAR
jgi:hypothetical protein